MLYPLSYEGIKGRGPRGPMTLQNRTAWAIGSILTLKCNEERTSAHMGAWVCVATKLQGRHALRRRDRCNQDIRHGLASQPPEQPRLVPEDHRRGV